MLKINLGTFILPNDIRVYKFFPGKAYKFHDLVAESRVAVLDVRGLDELGQPALKWTDDQLLDVISTDRVARKVARGAKQPSRLVHSVGDKQTLTFLRGLLLEARKGDIIVMPDKGYTTAVRIGMLTGEPGDLSSIEAIDDKQLHTYVGRKVTWLGSVQKRSLSQEMVNLLHSQAAFFNIGKSHYEEIFALSLEDYVYDGQYVSTFHTAKQVFTSKDNFLTSVWFELLQVLAEREHTGEKLADDDVYQLVIASDVDEEDRNDLSIVIQSPGWFRLRALDPSPLVAVALFALAAAGTPYEQAKTAEVHAKVVRQADDSCIGKVDESVRDYLNVLGKERWEQACKIAKQTKEQSKLSADARLTVRTK